MTTTTAYPSRDQGTERYYQIKGALWDHFYSLSLGQRASIIWGEILYIVLFICGWIAFSAFLKYGHVATAALFSTTAWAQTAVPRISSTEQIFKYTLWLVINLALVVVMLGCVCHMLFAKRKNQWVAKTGTFLIGFLAKSVAILLPT